MNEARKGCFGKRRRSWIILLAAPLIVGLIFLTIIQGAPPQPRYHGHTLKWWLQDVAKAVPSSDSPETYAARREASRRAVRAMGTNAIPSLLAWLRLPD